MATTRKRTSGFTEKPKETSEGSEVEAFLEAAADEILTQAEPEPKVKETPAPAPVVIESIIPTEDVGPRFVETLKSEAKEAAEQLPAVTAKPTPAIRPHPPKRHPRNIPKYSRYKEL
jgi:hypothetical protein